jgi:hypothetical protein
VPATTRRPARREVGRRGRVAAGFREDRIRRGHGGRDGGRRRGERRRQGGSADRQSLGESGWPSPWGAQDQRGANNRITPAKVKEAAGLIKTGKIYQLGQTLEKGIPLFGERLDAHVVIPGTPTGGSFGKQKLSP